MFKIYDRSCELRKDDEKIESIKLANEPTDLRQKRIVSNTSHTFDNYFVAPPSKYS